MNRYKNYIIAALAALALAGCGDFLEEESQSEVIPQTASDFAELLMGSGYPDGCSLGVTFLMDDDMGHVDTRYIEGSQAARTYFKYYTWQPDEMAYDGNDNAINTTLRSTEYADFYEKIMGCNAVLDMIDDSKGIQATKTRTKGEALAVRALLYFELVNLYGQPYNYNPQAPGVPLKLDTDLSDAPIARATVGEVYERVIVPGLVEAASLLDPLEVNHADYHINQPAVHILLSRVYLYMERWQDALAEAEKAMAMGTAMVDMVNDYDGTAVAGPLQYRYNSEVEWAFGDTPHVNAANGYYHMNYSPDFLALWDKTNDRRWTFYGLNKTGTNIVTKLSPSSTEPGQAIRACEAYLNQMEANLMLGNQSLALQQLNRYRSLRIVDYVDETLTGNDLTEAIRNERRKELCFEGHRWFDLRRYGMPEIHHTAYIASRTDKHDFMLSKNDPMYTLPLPDIALEYNSLLTQNDCRYGAERHYDGWTPAADEAE